MNDRNNILGSITAMVAVGVIGWSAIALAASQTVITKFSGVTSAAGSWTRTITDLQPNGPNEGSIQAVHVIVTSYGLGDNAAMVAAAYKAACVGTLPMAMGNPNGYGVQTENDKVPAIRVGKQATTFSHVDGAFPPGITVTDIVPGNSEHAPAASPAGLAAVVASMSALAWWARRRRLSV